jgi:hypothetical protein
MGFWRGVLNVVGAVPVIGHVTAGVQYLAGDKDGAQKSLAASTGNLCSTIGAVGGFAVGGPLGAAAGGAAGAALGGQIENKINGKALDLSLGKLGTDAVLGGATGIIGGGGLGNALKGAGTMLGKEVGKTTLKVATGSGLKTALSSTTGIVIKFVLLPYSQSFLIPYLQGHW